MARTTGPLMSLDASGSIAGALTFSKWKGRPYVRQLVIPANPQSPMQTAFRAMFKFLGSQWATMSAGNKATWEALAEQTKVSPFNAFMANNQNRWKSFLTPGQVYPVPNTGAVATLTSQTATGGIGMIQIAISTLAINQNWGWLLYRSPTTIVTPVQSQVIAVVPHLVNGIVNYVDSPLAPGTYHYRSQFFTLNGVTATANADFNGTAT